MTVNEKKCLDCDNTFAPRGRKVRCTDCQSEYKKEWRRLYHRKDMYMRRQQKYAQRSKQDALILSDNYMIGAGTINFQEYVDDFDKEYAIIKKLSRGIVKR